MNSLRRNGLVIVPIFLCLSYFTYRFYEGHLEAKTLHDETLKDAVSTVAVVIPKPVPGTQSIILPGNIVGWYEAPTYARVTGYVKMWYKDYGDSVKAGDILAEISTPDLDAEFQQARADLESERVRYSLADVTAQRWIAMRQNQAVSEQSITVQVKNRNAQAAVVKAAEQKVRNIEAFIKFKKIVAPFDGVVIQRNINVGDLVSKEGNLSTPNVKTNLFTVAVVDKLRLFVNVPETFGPFLQPGLTAKVTVPQLPHRNFNFDFLTVAKGFDVGTRTATTVFTIDNKDRALWPGSYAQVHLTAPVDRQSFTMPSTALVFQERGAQVAVVTDDDTVHLKDIKVAQLMDQLVEVEEGLSENDRIINNPSAALLEGNKVRIVTPEQGYDLTNISASIPAPPIGSSPPTLKSAEIDKETSP
ncbi:MAG: efflux RND transporter periplasmic adaptor subunit [Nitrospira sp.]|nr:efflux RND transporter periplasmic adaptor subunit [Nitrospira sp.]MBK9946713.1 efflux RND transporter periplasmic adaptor subunit [Nitrospira sp.]MBL8052537.1 efflux RND transporter periplasmic adaptor subunit [Nitrospira sp.]